MIVARDPYWDYGLPWLPSVEASHFALGFAEFDLFFEVLALIGVGFSFADAKFDFDAAVIPVDPQERERATLDGGSGREFEDFAFVKEEAAGAFGGVVEPLAGGLPWLDVAAIELSLIHI